MDHESDTLNDNEGSSGHTPGGGLNLKPKMQQILASRQPSYRSPLVSRKSNNDVRTPKQRTDTAGICPKDATNNGYSRPLSAGNVPGKSPSLRRIDTSRGAVADSPSKWSPAYRGPRGSTGGAIASHQSPSTANGLNSHRRLVDLFYLALENDSKSLNQEESLKLGYKMPNRSDLPHSAMPSPLRGMNVGLPGISHLRGDLNGWAEDDGANDTDAAEQLHSLGPSSGIHPPELPASFQSATQILRYCLNIDLALDALVDNSPDDPAMSELETFGGALADVAGFLEVDPHETVPSEHQHVTRMIDHIERLFTATQELERRLETKRRQFGTQYSGGITECTERLESLAAGLSSQRERLDAAKAEIARCKSSMTRAMARQLDTLERVAARFAEYDSRRWRKRAHLLVVVSAFLVAVVAVAAAVGALPDWAGVAPLVA